MTCGVTQTPEWGPVPIAGCCQPWHSAIVPRRQLQPSSDPSRVARARGPSW